MIRIQLGELHPGKSNFLRWTLIGSHGVRHNRFVADMLRGWLKWCFGEANRCLKDTLHTHRIHVCYMFQTCMPIGSMNGIGCIGIFIMIYIYHTNQVDVGRYTMHLYRFILWDSMVTMGIRPQYDRSFLVYRNHKMLGSGNWEAEFGT